MGLWLFYTSCNRVRSCAPNLLKPFIRMCSCMVGLLVIICNWASYAAILIRQILWNMGLWPFSNYSWILFRHFKQKVIICERPQTVYFWCSSLTFARGSNQPFISNAIVFLSSSRADSDIHVHFVHMYSDFLILKTQ
jgi:hypothetical protein